MNDAYNVMDNDTQKRNPKKAWQSPALCIVVNPNLNAKIETAPFENVLVQGTS
ncbi:hypothetical protein BBG19_0084 [Francisella sp. MA067296]|nr:hypothetical protein BBG19_0084 [Francisella sp. MA067296]